MTEKPVEKAPLEMLPVRPLMEVAHVIAFGTQKRGETAGWKSGNGISYMKYAAKILRHCFEFEMGIDADHESGKSPLDHLIADALILRDCQLRGVGVDDREK